MKNKIKIPATRYHLAVNIISVTAIGIMVVMLILSWSNLPTNMPVHFNMRGEADAWGGKGHILALVLVNIGLYTVMCICEKFPQIWNTGVTLTESNRDAVYMELKNMLVTIKMVMVLIFSYAIYTSVTLQGISFIFAILVLLATLGTSAFFLLRIFYIAKKFK